MVPLSSCSLATKHYHITVVMPPKGVRYVKHNLSTELTVRFNFFQSPTYPSFHCLRNSFLLFRPVYITEYLLNSALRPKLVETDEELLTAARLIGMVETADTVAVSESLCYSSLCIEHSCWWEADSQLVYKSPQFMKHGVHYRGFKRPPHIPILFSYTRTCFILTSIEPISY